MSRNFQLSGLIKQTPETAAVKYTMDSNAVFAMAPFQSTLLEYKKDIPGNPSLIRPGQPVTISHTYNAPRYFSRERHMYIAFKLANTTGQTLTIKNPYNLLESFRYKFNNGEWTELKSPLEITMTVEDNLRGLGEHMLEYMQIFREEDTTFNGISIATAASHDFLIPVYPIIDFIENNAGVYSGIQSFAFEFRFRNVPSNADLHTKWASSGTNATAYTQTGIEFQDICLRQVQTRVQMQALQITRPISSTYLPLRWASKDFAFNGSVAGTKSSIIKISEIHKQPWVQDIRFFWVPDRTTFNDADAGIRYSGYQYFTWKISLSGAESEFKLDFTDTTEQYRVRFLKDLELNWQKLRFNNRLPIAEYGASPSGLTQHFLTHSVIPLNFEFQDHSNGAEIINMWDTNIRDLDLVVRNEQILPEGGVGTLTVVVSYYDPRDVPMGKK